MWTRPTRSASGSAGPMVIAALQPGGRRRRVRRDTAAAGDAGRRSGRRRGRRRRRTGRRLAGRDGPDRRVGLDDPAAAAGGLAGRRRPDRRRRAARGGGSGPRPGTAPAHRRRGRGRRVGDEASRRSSAIVRVSRSSRRPSTIVLVSGSIRRHVARLAERDAEALALADGVARRARRAPPPASPSASSTGPGSGAQPAALAQRVAVVAAGHEADLLALGLVGGHEAEAAGDRRGPRACVSSPSGNRACHSWSWRRPYRK